MSSPPRSGRACPAGRAPRQGASPQRPGAGPLQQAVQGPGGDDPLRRHAVAFRPLGTVLQEIELARGVGVAVDAEEAAGVEGQLDQGARRVLAFRP